MSALIDGHFHIWRQADLPWLAGPMQPRIFGPYGPIRRDYTIEEYRAEAAASGVTKAVYVQANWPPEQFEQEVRWVEDAAERTGWPHAIVAYADFQGADVRPQLDVLREYRRVRGVRMQLHWHARPEYRFASSARLATEERVQRNIAYLAEYGLPFELQVFPAQMADCARLLEANPRTPFILVHAGMLTSDDAAVVEEWRSGLRKLSRYPNAHIKLSGLGTFVHRIDARQIELIVREAVAQFGAERCLFGSNFPIEKLWSDFATLLHAHQQATASFTQEQRKSIFHDTAARLYRL